MPPVNTFARFRILHLVNIHLDVVHGNTVFGKVVDVVIVVTALQSALLECNPRSSTCRPNGAHFDTLFNQLTGFNGGDVAAGPPPVINDRGDCIIVRCDVLSSFRSIVLRQK
jgi:hypothetical protein